MHSKTEISDLGLTLLDENISQLDISMHYVLRIQIFESLKHILDVGINLVLSHSSFLLEFFL